MKRLLRVSAASFGRGARERGLHRSYISLFPPSYEKILFAFSFVGPVNCWFATIIGSLPPAFRSFGNHHTICRVVMSSGGGGDAVQTDSGLERARQG